VTTGKSSGKFCIAVTETSVTGRGAVAIASATESLTGFPGTGGPSVAFYGQYTGQQIYANNTVFAQNPNIATLANGETVTIVVDATNALAWFSTPEMVAAGTNWNHSLTANPTNGTGGVSISYITAPYYLMATDPNSGGTFTVNSTSPNCPSGIPTWDSVVATGGHPITVILGQNNIGSILLPMPVSFSLN